MAVGDVGVWMRLAPTCTISEMPSTSYTQAAAGTLGSRSKKCCCTVREARPRNSGQHANVCIRGLIGSLHTQKRNELHIWAPGKCTRGKYRHRGQLQILSGLIQGEGSCSWVTPGKSPTIFHCTQQVELFAGIEKKPNPLLDFLTLLFGDGGSGGGNHNRGGGGGGSGNEEEGFHFTNGRHILAGLLSLTCLVLGSRRGLGLWIFCLSAASAGFLLSSCSQFGGVAYALTTTSFSKPRRLADGTSGNENGPDVSEVHSGKDLEGAIWEVKGSKWQRYILDEEKDDFVPDVVKQNETEAEAYELSCQEEKVHERLKSEVDSEYAAVRSRLAKQVEDWEAEKASKLLKTVEETSGKKHLNLHSETNSEKSESESNANGADSEQAQRGEEAPSSIQRQLRSVLDYCGEVTKQVMLPEGYPRSVTDDYTEFTMWRMGQIIASQISGVLTTQVRRQCVELDIWLEELCGSSFLM